MESTRETSLPTPPPLRPLRREAVWTPWRQEQGSISIGHPLGRLQGSEEILRVRRILRIPNFMTCLMPHGRGCHSPILPTLVPATSIPGLPTLRTSENHVWRMNIPILGYQGIWKESVVTLTTAAWIPTNLPSPLPPSYYSSYYINSILWKLIIKGQE